MKTAVATPPVLALACSFVAGAALAQSEPALPDPMWCAVLPLAVWFAIVRPRAAPMLAAVAGYTWAAFLAHVQMGASLPAAVEGRDLVITGVVRGLPVADPLRARFDFDVEAVEDGALEAEDNGLSVIPGGRVRLSWYRVRAAPVPGSVWRLTVRLRRPRGMLNPGGSDYEGRLFADRILATGYVKSGRRLGTAPALSFARLDTVRAELSRSIRATLEGYGSEDLIRALAIGDRSGITESRWRMLRVTGTAHLMAISGLHVGMAAAAAYWVALRTWVLVPRAALLVPAPQIAGVAAMLAAFGYSLLAGLALPTQRAMLMLAVVFASQLSRRRILPSHGLALALVAVLAADPHSVRAPGFWLSFVAVAAIVLALSTRPAAAAVGARTLAGRLRALGTVQIAVTVGLAPVTLSVFAEQSLVSPFVNALAIPLVGTLVVPVILLGLLAGAAFPAVAALLLSAAATVLDLMWPALEWIGAHTVMLRAPGEIGAWQLAAAAVGVLIVLAPRGLLIRRLGLVWMLPLIMVRPAPIEPGAYRVTVLDVGNGLSVVVETARRVLVYDTGPRMGTRLDAAALAVLPYLARRGHDTVDRVVLSHGDSDHTGGYRRLAESIAVRSMVANGAVGPHRPDAECMAGHRWTWDGVAFEVLYPFEGRLGFANAHSCVLRIEGTGGSILLTGDVERAGERALVARRRKALAVDVLVVPHHGSTTSSTPRFIDAVSPSVALFSAGERGRHRLPHPRVVARYADAGIVTYSTSRCGAVTLEFVPGRGPRIVRLEREAGRRYWHAGGLPCRGGPPPGPGPRSPEALR